MLLLPVTCTDDSDSVGVRVGCGRTTGLRVPPEGRLRGLAAAMALNEVVRASPRPRLGPAGGRTDALTPGATASLAAGPVRDRWPHPTGWGRAGILPRSRGPREGQGSAPRALRGRTRNQPPRRHPSSHWHGPSPANGDRPRFSPSASPASRRLRPLLGFLQKQTSESAPSERREGGAAGARGGTTGARAN